MGATWLSDYGAEHMLNKTFECADTFQVALFTAGTQDDTPVLEEVEAAMAGYARKILSNTHGALEWQTITGATSSIDAGIATYVYPEDSSGNPLDFVFTGPLTSVNKVIIGYAVLLPGTHANPFAASSVLHTQLLDYGFEPKNAGDTLSLKQINIRLSKGTVS